MIVSTRDIFSKTMGVRLKLHKSGFPFKAGCPFKARLKKTWSMDDQVDRGRTVCFLI